MSWPSTASAISALRTLLKDNPTDKLCSTKPVIGTADAANKIFKTFEDRRITDFTDAMLGFPLGVYLDGVKIAATGVAQDDPQSGTFQLAGSAPGNRSSLRATYYYHWFLDVELQSFLENACTWLGLGLVYINVPDGLNAALLRFAAQEAYLALAMKYSQRMSEVYKLEDAPSEEILKALAAFKDMADSFMESAEDLRDDYYTRQGQSLAPNFGFALGSVVDPQPRR